MAVPLVAQFSGRNLSCAFTEVTDGGFACQSLTQTSQATSKQDKLDRTAEKLGRRKEIRTSTDILNRHGAEAGRASRAGRVMVVDRGGGCSFFDKGSIRPLFIVAPVNVFCVFAALRAVEAGASFLIVINSEDGAFEMKTGKFI